ncbi:MAG: hypothetical protein ACK4TK_03755 [Thiobacillaceae bacterium]
MRATLVLSALLPLLAQAQDAPVYPRLDYRSVLADYVPYREAEMADWRMANDTVGRLGGHMGHVEPQAQEPKRGPDALPRDVQPAGQGGRQP